MITGFDRGSKKSKTILSVYCPKSGPSQRMRFVNKAMIEAGYDVIEKPVTREMCGANPVNVIVDEWPRINNPVKESSDG